MFLGGLILLAWALWHSRAKCESSPAGTPTVITQNLTASERLTAGAAADKNQPLTAACVPFVNVVPSQDGTGLFISISGFESCGTICVNVSTWHTYDWHCCTMAPCVITVSGFTPNVNTSGFIRITSTLGLDTMVDFNRAYVPASTVQSINSLDGNLQLTLVSTDTIPFDTYVVVTTNYGPPGPAPMGHRFVGSTYSVRAAGALMATDKPMSLHLYYDEITLGDANPHNLAIFTWDAYHKGWNDLGGHLFRDQQYLAVATSRFATYALMSTPSWRDEFADDSGLNPTQPDNVTLNGSPDNRVLVLENTPGRGSAVSQPIRPTTNFTNWGSLTFTRTVDPPTTTLTVDVLSLDGAELLTNVASGTSLADLDPAQYPALKLRANLSSTVAGETPALDQWQLAWQVQEYKVYLPVILK
jgi:hypothetical protein